MDKSMEDAIRYISFEIQDNAQCNIAKLIESASQQFDLTPIQTEFLINKFIVSR